MITMRCFVRFAFVLLFALMPAAALAASSTSPVHVWEKQSAYLPGQSVSEPLHGCHRVWVDLAGPNFKKRVYGFWDGDQTFRVRVVATEPGQWTWTSGSSPSDDGLTWQQPASFTSGLVDWTAEKEQNPLRRGFIRATSNGHALQYADGTPYFIKGDTWWSLGTFHFPWFDDDNPRPIGPQAGIKDYIRFRKSQGFNRRCNAAEFSSVGA